MVFHRKDPLVNGQVYHVYTKSIAGFKIFKKEAEFQRMMGSIRFYQRANPPRQFSQFIRLHEIDVNAAGLEAMLQRPKMIDIIAYCIMPTHLHLLLMQMMDRGISTFMSVILNSYSRYFNVKHKRKGPLWQGRFESVLVTTDEQLLHLTRYIHLNPVTAHLVDAPEEWIASSYREYITPEKSGHNEPGLCHYADLLDIDPVSYREFVRSRIDYQRELAKIKEVLLD